MSHELDLMASTLDKIYAILEANPRAKEKVEAAMEQEISEEHEWCEKHGMYFPFLHIPGCPFCAKSWDVSIEADRKLDQAREDKHEAQ